MNSIMSVFRMDLSYFTSTMPVSTTILNIMYAVGWALLLGNLVFQAARSMMSGLGFEADDPKVLGLRTFVFAFLLICSRQICEIGLGLGAKAVALLQVPSSVSLPKLSDNMFSIDASWLLVLIMGIIMVIQLVKFFFEVGERYVILGVLTILSPLAFAMGGSRSTSDIFKGWARMYGSMCLMMVLNVVFVKLIVSAVSNFPSGNSSIAWLILLVALARTARKIDNIVARIGLNPAITGQGLGRGLPGMLALMVGKSLVSSAINSRMAAGKATAGAARGSAPNPSATSSGFTGGARPAPSPINTNVTGGAYNTNHTSSAGTSPANGIPSNPPVGRAGTAQQGFPGGTPSVQSSVHSKTSANSQKGTAGPPIAPIKGDVTSGRNAAGAVNSPKPAQPPRGAGDSKPLNVSGLQQTQSRTQGAGMAERSSSIPKGGVSSVHIEANTQSVQQGSRGQVNVVSTQTEQQGTQVQKNTQNQARAGSAPQPVHAQAGNAADSVNARAG